MWLGRRNSNNTSYLLNTAYSCFLMSVVSRVVLFPPRPVAAFCNLTPSQINQSMWSQFAEAAVFVPVSQRDAFEELLTQSDELAQVLNYFKRRYVRNVFQEQDFSVHQSLYSHLTFLWLLPNDDRAKTHRTNLTDAFTAFQSEGVDSLFYAAYAAFQRVAVALDLVDQELTNNGEYADKCGRFWRLSKQTANRAVEAAYVLLRARRGASEAAAAPVVTRAAVPNRLRCVLMESRRNLRDWVVLADSMAVASFYRDLLFMLQEANSSSGSDRRKRGASRLPPPLPVLLRVNSGDAATE